MNPPKATNVIVAEDDYLVAEMIKGVLDSNRYHVVAEAADGLQAVDLTNAHRPDVVIMDIQMPGMDGIEASRQIQQTCPTPVVVLTAYDDPVLVNQAVKAGIGAYLLKPPDERELDRAIAIAMARFHDLAELRRLNGDLEKALAEIKTLRGIIPICVSCKRIRDDQGFWQRVDVYVRDHSEAEFSHSYCPECARKLYPDYADEEDEPPAPSA